MKTITLAIVSLLTIAFTNASAQSPSQLLWGDTHLHTSYSMDAYLFGNKTADPDTAYRYAKGLPVIHPGHRARIQIDTPLDFLVVADHSEYLGMLLKLGQGDELLNSTEVGSKLIQDMKDGKGAQLFRGIVAASNSGKMEDSPLYGLGTPEVVNTIWKELIDAAERHNDPGNFTALLGWEWSSLIDGANLHRVVLTDASTSEAEKFVPFSSLDSQHPEDLWGWMDKTATKNEIDFLAIPHNSNISKGRMFSDYDSQGELLSKEYLSTRQAWEPVAEVTQIKGDSETHPELSPNDPFADFENYRFLIDMRPDTQKISQVDKAGYVRSALQSGLQWQQKLNSNPFKLGMIGSTDSHTGIPAAEESNYHGKFVKDATPEGMDWKGSRKGGPTGWDRSASGLAAVWAEANTREAIFAAFKRREVYATTGPRIGLRLFGGWNFKAADAKPSKLVAAGYKKGVPMGGDLIASDKKTAPGFLLHAIKDPNGANLDRAQIVKSATTADGQIIETIYDAALSSSERRAADGSVAVVGNTVDSKSASYTNTIGASELTTFWQDPDFDPDQYAFYYLRVLQIPTPRHTLFDEIALQQDKPALDSIQERAYSSPIWYSPN